MVDPELLEMVANREAGLPGADDDNGMALGRRVGPAEGVAPDRLLNLR